MKQPKETFDIMELVTDVVSAYISNNTIEPADLPAFVQLVKRSLLSINAPYSLALTSRSEPAVPIEKSVQPDYIVCLEDGKKLKMLKRHLKTAYNMTPDDYRARWGLPITYPMVAPNYAATRQGIARKIGLGHTKKNRKKTAA